MRNIPQTHANQLLEMTADLLVTLRSWGFHHSDMFKFKDADTGKIKNPEKSSFHDMERLVLTIRHMMKMNPRRVRNVMRFKTYAPDWRHLNHRWQILRRKQFPCTIVLLCKRGSDYAVFTELCIDKSYPSDKYAGSLKEGIRVYREVCKKEEGNSHLDLQSDEGILSHF